MEPIHAVVRAIGRRNLVYVVGTLLLIPFGLAVEAAGPHGPDSGGGLMLAYVLWLGASGLYVAVNLVLLALGIVGQSAHGPAPVATPISRAAIACALPFVVAVAAMSFG